MYGPSARKTEVQVADSVSEGQFGGSVKEDWELSRRPVCTIVAQSGCRGTCLCRWPAVPINLPSSSVTIGVVACIVGAAKTVAVAEQMVMSNQRRKDHGFQRDQVASFKRDLGAAPSERKMTSSK